MRIKFRVFNKKNQQMYEAIRGISFDYETGEAKYVGLADAAYGLCIDEDIVLIQYTGLKDKHGKEIYEGDILGNEWGKYHLYWDTGGFTAKSEDGFRFHLSDIEFNALEVLGNIYKNPNLLETS